MTLTALKTVEPDTFTAADREVALTASRALSRLHGRGCVHVEAVAANEPPQTFALPAAAVRMLTDMLVHLADGRSVAVMPSDAEVTTQQAADMLNVSRPYLIRLLEEEKIKFRLTGTHRRIKLEDLLTYRRQRDTRARSAMDELAAEAQELDMGY